jgi:hypothetical protein
MRSLISIFFCTIVPCSAAVFSFTGNLGSGDGNALFAFTMAQNSTVTIRTFGFAGGTNGANTVIPDGGFDPYVVLFDLAGDAISINDDGGCGSVGTDSGTQTCTDSLIINSLQAGSYQVSLTQTGNILSTSSLLDGFTQTGNPTYACDPFNVQGQFCETSNGGLRTSAWALDISFDGDGSAQGPGNSGQSVPEPTAWMTVAAGLALLTWQRRR